MSEKLLPPSLRQASELILILYAAAAEAARAAARQGAKSRTKSRRNCARRPGSDTPLWNTLVKQAQPFLSQRGSKAHLARLLEVPRQRIQDCLKARHSCLDAERTLTLLCWVSAKQQGREFAV